MSQRKTKQMIVAQNTRALSVPVAPKRRKNRKNNRSRRSKRNQAIMAASPAFMRVRPCTQNYIQALFDPWATYKRNESVCLPDDQDLPSFKYSCRNRGTFTIGTAGFGGILCDPHSFGVSTEFSIGSTASTYTGAAFPASTGAVTGWIETGSSSPMSNSNMLYRAVAFGLRVRYTGTELNRGGQMIPYRSTSMSSTDNCAGFNANSVASLNRSELEPNNRQWVGAVFTPTTAADRVFKDNPDDISSSINTWNICVCLTGTAGNTYEYDAVGYYEAISSASATLPSVTKSDTDLDGYSFVRDVYSSMADSVFGQSAMKILKEKALSYAASAAVPVLQLTL